MIYVTGDAHCPIDIAKLNTKKFPAQRTMTKVDYLIICGDVGIVWEPGSGEDRWWQEEIPSEEEREEAFKNLECAGWKVDYVITHTAPDRMIQKIGAVNRQDAFTGFYS